MASLTSAVTKPIVEAVEERGLKPLIKEMGEWALGTLTSSESSIGRTEVGKSLIDHLKKFEPYNKQVPALLEQKSSQALGAGTQAVNNFATDSVRELSRRGVRVKIAPGKSAKLGDAINAGRINPTQLTAYDEKVFQDGTDLNKQAVKHLLDSGQVAHVAEAQEALRSIGAGYHGRDAASHYLSHGYDLPVGKLDPQITLRKFALDAGRKISEVDFFGNNDEILNGFIEAAKRSEGLTHADAINDFLTVYLKDRVGRFNYTGQSRMERSIRETASWMFTSRIAVPHITQWLNEGLHANMSSMWKATSEMMRDYESTVKFTTRSGAYVDELRYEIQAIADKQKEGWVGKILHQPFFKAERKLELTHAAVTGKYEALRLNDLIQADKNNKEANVMLKFFGIDPAKVIERGGLTQKELEIAGFRSAQEVMFIRTARHTPYTWEKNGMTRIMAMYKHFMFNEGAHIYQSLKRAKSIGPMSLLRQIAYIGTVFPVAGQMIQYADNLITGHEVSEKTVEPFKFFHVNGEIASEADAYLNAVAHMAGFGLATAMLRSAKNRGLYSFFGGPIFSSVIDVGQDAYQAVTGTKTGKHNIAPLGRDIVRKIPVAGPAISHWLFPPEKKGGSKVYY